MGAPVEDIIKKLTDMKSFFRLNFESLAFLFE